MAQVFTPGRMLILLANLSYALGAFAADYSESHLFNPTWPRHARFHNGQTMSLGACLATASIYFALRPAFTKTTISEKESVFDAAVIGSFYCFAGLTAALYPGTHWCDPGFEEQCGAQKVIFPVVLAVMWSGYALEMYRLGKAKAA